MDYIAPPLQLIAHVKRGIEAGNSVRSGIQAYLRSDRSDFAIVTAQWLSLRDQGIEASRIFQSQKSQYRRSLLELLERGLCGEGIYVYLCQLEVETMEACQDEISRKLSKLPFLLMGPLLLLQFPAFLLLLFGPLLDNFFHSLGAG